MFQGIQGAGPVDPMHQTVQTPSRDGETWVRAILPPRFLIVQEMLHASTRADMAAMRRALSAALNPKLGLGTVEYVPVDGGDTYSIQATYASGAGFGSYLGSLTQGPLHISFRCPDPAWLQLPVNTNNLVVPDTGLSVPVSIPLSILDTSISGVISNGGDLDSYPVITANGPFDGLIVANSTTGKSVSFPALSAAAGQTLTIDMDARTALVGTTNVMPYRSSDSESWPLVTGDNTIVASTSSGGTTVTLTWHTRLLGV